MTMLEEAAKRDPPQAGPRDGPVPTCRKKPGPDFLAPERLDDLTTLQDYMRRQQRRDGYVEVNTPQVVNRKLWEASGLWENYRENMFSVEVDEEGAREKVVNALKPMKLPLPCADLQRWPEILPRPADPHGRVWVLRAPMNPAGALHGIMRVRGFTQDDAHIFCRLDQIEAEIDQIHRIPCQDLFRPRV